MLYHFKFFWNSTTLLYFCGYLRSQRDRNVVKYYGFLKILQHWVISLHTSCSFLAAPADIIPCGHYTTVSIPKLLRLTSSSSESSQNLYFAEKYSLQNRRSCACFQLGVKICLSTPRTLLLKSGVELFWFPENKATSRCFACSLKEITVLWWFIIPQQRI